MTGPTAWTSSRDIVAAIAAKDWRAWFREERRKHSHHDWRWVVEHWVGPNSYRAFRHMPERPCEVFREWAHNALFGEERRFEQLLALKSRIEYDCWLDLLAGSLRRRWAARMNGREMPFGPSLKLPNLILKGICANPRLENCDFDRIVWWLHVPLDSYSILAIRNCIAATPYGVRIGKIGMHVAMGFVKDHDAYSAFQEYLRELAEEASVPAITFDILSWDTPHAGAPALEAGKE